MTAPLYRDDETDADREARLLDAQPHQHTLDDLEQQWWDEMDAKIDGDFPATDDDYPEGEDDEFSF